MQSRLMRVSCRRGGSYSQGKGTVHRQGDLLRRATLLALLAEGVARHVFPPSRLPSIAFLHASVALRRYRWRPCSEDGLIYARLEYHVEFGGGGERYCDRDGEQGGRN